MYTMSGKKSPSFLDKRYNFHKFRQFRNFWQESMNHPDTLYLTSSKMSFTDKDGHLTKAFQNEKLQVNRQKNMRTETGVIVD